MKFIHMAALLLTAYVVLSVGTYVLLTPTVTGHGNIWDVPHGWRYDPGGLRQMAAAGSAAVHGSSTDTSTGTKSTRGELVERIKAYNSGLRPASAGGRDTVERPPAPPLRGGGDLPPQQLEPQNIPGRFPLYSTPEFNSACRWTLTPSQHGPPDCTVFVRPKPGEKEGMALWVTQVVMGYILARQAGCRLLLDYGTEVDLHSVVTVAPDLGMGRGGNDDDDNDRRLHDWTVPDGFVCRKEDRCYALPDEFSRSKSNVSFTEPIPGRVPLASIPFYRFALWGTGDQTFYVNQFRDLERVLPGFQIPTGMACSLGRVFHLAPTASQYEVRLFTDLLPRLRDPDSLVLTLYVRTSQTEKGVNATEDTEKHVRYAKGYIRTALDIEEKYLTGAMDHPRDVRRIVWLVVSDSSSLKQAVADTYGGENVNAKISPPSRQRFQSREIRRDVLFTTSRGAHTRASQNPSTVDFAQAFIDWFLIGESDVVLVAAFTFGLTGSLRTARPVYNKKGKRLELVHEGEPTPGRQIQVNVKLGQGPVAIKKG